MIYTAAYTSLPNFQTYQGTFTYFLHVIVSSLHFYIALTKCQNLNLPQLLNKSKKFQNPIHHVFHQETF